MMRWAIAALFLLLAGAAHAACPPLPYNLTNGTVADANQVMANFNSVNSCAGAVGGFQQVANNAALKALSGMTAGTTIFRAGFAAAGDGGSAWYVYSLTTCSLFAGIGDNGSQVQPNNLIGCWNIDKNKTFAIDNRIFGALDNCSTNDAVADQNAINYADSLAPYGVATSTGFRPVVTFGGLCSFISAQLKPTNTNGIRITSGVLKADPAVNWSVTYPDGMLNIDKANNIRGFAVDHMTFDGSLASPGVSMSGHASYFQFEYNYIFHIKTFGLHAQGIRDQYNTIEELFAGDAGYSTYPGGYTADCLLLDGDGDGIYIGDTTISCLHNIAIGDAGGGGSNANILIGQHPWHGASITDPVDIILYSASRGNTFTNLYLDDGIVEVIGTSNKFLGIHPTYNATTLTAFFNLVATSASQGLDSFGLFPPNQTSSVAAIPWFNCTAQSGGDNWAVSSLICGGGGLGTGSATSDQDMTISDSPNTVLATGTVVSDLYTNATSAFISLSANFPGDDNVSIGRDASTNNVFMADTNGSVGVNSAGHLVSTGPTPTCTSGCGTGPTITGGDSIGTVTLGTGPSASFVITFGNVFVGVPSCHVEEYNNGSGVSSINPMADTLTVTPTSPTAGTRFTWHCWDVNRG